MATLTSFLKLYKPVANEVGWDDNMNANLDALDAFVRQFMNIPNFQGAWLNSHSYAVGQVALDGATGNLFQANVTHVSAADPTTFAQDRAAHPTFWVNADNVVQGSVDAAAASAAAAKSSQTGAAASATAAANSLAAFQATYYGSFATDPVVDPNGNPRTDGDLYFNSTTHRMRVFAATPAPGGWIEITISAGSVTEAPINTTTAYGRFNATWTPVLRTSAATVNQLVISNLVVGNNGTLALLPTTPNIQNTGYILSDTTSSFNIGYNFVFVPGSSPQSFNYLQANLTAYRMHLQGNVPIGNITGQGLSIDMGLGAFVAGGPAQLAPAMQIQNVGNMRILGSLAAKAGGGAWIDTSDARIKNIVGDYPAGLAELLEMLPKMFTYKGNDNLVNEDGSMGAPAHPDTTKQFYGLIAQDCEPYMPELVTQTTCYIDGVLETDVRVVDTTAVTMALVNAVAELNGMIGGGQQLSSPDVSGDGPSNNVQIDTGDAVDPTGTSGGVTLTSGAAGSVSGDMNLTTGSVSETGGWTGYLNISTGYGAQTNSGNVGITTGNINGVATVSGSIGLLTGTAIGGNGSSGGINITTGTPSGTGTRGDVTIDGNVTHVKSPIHVEGAVGGPAIIDVVPDPLSNPYTSYYTASTTDATNTTGIWVSSGSADGSGNSGEVDFGSGNSNTGNSGLTYIFSGDATGGGNSGDIQIITGAGTTRGAVKIDGGALSFFGATPHVKPTVSGSRGGNAALASLVSALAQLGLVTDSTTA